jgi:hypothetical protein
MQHIKAGHDPAIFFGGTPRKKIAGSEPGDDVGGV